MSQSVLNKIWSFLAVTVVYLSLNVWSITQQWQLTLPGNPFKESKTTPYGVALYGLFLCAPLLITVSIVTRVYAVRSKASFWADRVPRFADFALNTRQREARAFQLIALFLCLLLPAIAILHFQNKVLNGSVFRLVDNCTPNASNGYCRAAKPSMSGWREMLFSSPKDANARGRLVYDPDLSKDIAPRFVPLWEPWGLLVLSLLTLSFVVWSMTAILPPHRKHFGNRSRRVT
jgi:hypothetical protein